MTSLNRRQLLKAAALSPLAGWTWQLGRAAAESTDRIERLRIAPFAFDVTPPIGHSCCGGWIRNVEVVDDGLEAIGFVLTGLSSPIVVCAVDWTALCNSAHIEWRAALAKAAGTSADRVAVQCVHQHNAPFACLDTQRLISPHDDLPPVIQTDFFARCLERGQEAISSALPRAKRVTGIGTSQAKVDRVASNRRVKRDEQNRIIAMRGSSCRDPELRALPEGLIDPWLKTVAFYSGDEPVVACNYYATHPMSYYADGRVSSDFVGLARKQHQAETAGCQQIYFTGCSGNVAAGKYNDGSKQRRSELTKRIFSALQTSFRSLQPEPVRTCGWKSRELVPEPRGILDSAAIRTQIADSSLRTVQRSRPAYALAWIERVRQGTPIILSGLHVNGTSLLHLPAECFVEYQLKAQQLGEGRFVATAAYGDGGPWYLPTSREYPSGGYEVSVAFCEPSIEEQLTEGIRELLLDSH